MLASVFFMQPLGQILGNIVSIIVIAISRGSGSDNDRRTFDQMWRWVIGIGAVPGVVGVLFRFAIPETPRFLLDIEDDPVKAEFDATELFGGGISEVEIDSTSWDIPRSDSMTSEHRPSAASLNTQAHWTIGEEPNVTLNSSWTLSRQDIRQYFWVEKNWITLAGTMLCWLLLDFGFYGLSLSSPKFLAKTWGSLDISGPTPYWKTSDNPAVNIYSMFFNTSLHALLILNLGSFIGGILMITFAAKINRVSLQKYGFLGLAALFIILGVIFLTIQQEGAAVIVLYIICQTLFNFGPNATTYIIPAELFPTRYRATCHGLSAGAGKLGSILVQIFGAYYRTGSNSPGVRETKRYGVILIVFSGIMILGSLVTHFMVPDVQEKRKGWKSNWGGRTKRLEELAVGRAGKESEAMVRARRRRVVE